MSLASAESGGTAPDTSVSTFYQRRRSGRDFMVIDGWMGYHGITGLGYAHVWRSQRAARARGGPRQAAARVHRVASLAKRWLLGTHQGPAKVARRASSAHGRTIHLA
jgi:hypothetical protein